MKKYDLHTHSTYSDGELTPEKLVQYAASRKIDVLALTDHDTVDGIAQALEAGLKNSITVIAGLEISANWQTTEIHIVGLYINHTDALLQKRLAQQQQCRIERAHRIGDKLAHLGIPNAFLGANAIAGDGVVTRPHFARFLIAEHVVHDMKTAFSRYLGDNAPAFVPTLWCSMTQAVQWILDVGGIPILAHPGRYGLSPTELNQLVSEFKSIGGVGVEVLSPAHSPAMQAHLAELCVQKTLVASSGSDFHGPTVSDSAIGLLPPLPDFLTPVWEYQRIGI